jgi:hypothetical protein
MLVLPLCIQAGKATFTEANRLFDQPIPEFIDLYGGAENNGYGSFPDPFPDPFGGRGWHQPMDLVTPRSEVIFYAWVAYNMDPVAYDDVTFLIEGPQGYSYAMYARTGENGIAYVTFEMPWPRENPEGLMGIWNVTATTYVNGVEVVDVMSFFYGYMVDILGVTTNKLMYERGESVEMTVTYGTFSMQCYPALFSIYVLDSLKAQIGSIFSQYAVGGAPYGHMRFTEFSSSITIPLYANAGYADITVDCFDKDPGIGGLPWCPQYQKESAFTIQGAPHDVAVYYVVASQSQVTVGDSLHVSVFVKNFGTQTETFSVTAYRGSGKIGFDTETVTLAAGETRTLDMVWDTTGVVPDIYQIGAYASQVPGETNLANNDYQDGMVLVLEAPPTTYNVFFEQSGISNPAQVWGVTLDGYGTQYSNGPGNTIYTVVFAGVANGGPYQFVVTPPSGFVAQPTSGTITVNGVDFHQQITFNPAPTTYTFTLTAGSGGSVSYSFSLGSGTVLSGQSQQLIVPQNCQFSLTANPDSTHMFQTWSTTGSVAVSNPSSASTTATVNGNGGVTANFAYKSVLTITSGNGGTVSYFSSYGSGTVLSGQSTNLQIPSGGQVSLTANPDSLHVFQTWSTTGSVAVSNPSSASTTATVNGNGGVTANFKVSTYSLTFMESGLRLCEGVSWSVTLDGPNFHKSLSSTTSTIKFNVPENVYTFSVAPIAGYVTLPASGTVVVDEEGIVRHITFSPIVTVKGISSIITGANTLVANTEFTLQQNFYLYTGNEDGQGNPEVWWCQNCVEMNKTVGQGRYVRANMWVWKCYWDGSRISINQNENESSYGYFRINPPDKISFKSYIGTDNKLHMENDIAWLPWVPNKVVLTNNAYITCEFISSSENIIAPNFVIVGPAGGGKAVFRSGGGTVSCLVEIGGTWDTATYLGVVGPRQSTGEVSEGLDWSEDSQGCPSGIFGYNSKVWYDQGVFFGIRATSGMAVVSGGAVFVDHTSLTDVLVDISGSSSQDGTLVTITTIKLIGVPNGITQVSTTPAAYYDVNVQGINDGIATIYITNNAVTSQTTMQYWNGAQWIQATDVVVSGNTIRGNIPVSALTGTIIAIGPLSSPPPSVTISPLSASILDSQSVTFTSTVSGGIAPYSFQWFLNGNPVSGATSNTWTFIPASSGIYYVYLKVTDAIGNTKQSDTARITVATVPVGGYSIPILGQATVKPITPYIILTAFLTIAYTTIKRKTTKKTKKT